jgi:hypothetical protein
MNYKNLIRVILLGQLLLITPSSFSEEMIFHCTVLQVMQVDDLGHLDSISKEKISIVVIGTAFTIDRTTGAILGPNVSTEHAKSISVVDRGDKYNNFKVSGVIVNMHPANFFIEVHSSLRLGDKAPMPPFPFSGYFKYVHISGLCN